MASSESKSVSPFVSIGVIAAIIAVAVFLFLRAANTPSTTQESVTMPPDVAAHFGAQRQGPASTAQQAQQHH